MPIAAVVALSLEDIPVAVSADEPDENFATEHRRRRRIEITRPLPDQCASAPPPPPALGSAVLTVIRASGGSPSTTTAFLELHAAANHSFAPLDNAPDACAWASQCLGLAMSCSPQSLAANTVSTQYELIEAARGSSKSDGGGGDALLLLVPLSGDEDDELAHLHLGVAESVTVAIDTSSSKRELVLTATTTADKYASAFWHNDTLSTIRELPDQLESPAAYTASLGADPSGPSLHPTLVLRLRRISPAYTGPVCAADALRPYAHIWASSSVFPDPYQMAMFPPRGTHAVRVYSRHRTPELEQPVHGAAVSGHWVVAELIDAATATDRDGALLPLHARYLTPAIGTESAMVDVAVGPVYVVCRPPTSEHTTAPPLDDWPSRVVAHTSDIVVAPAIKVPLPRAMAADDLWAEKITRGAVLGGVGAVLGALLV
ncbi:hypothetical protein BC828DRAFT_396542 [Blastocladiella britannica]|nr:hypothetical protein BC828DRAFT_396542 [Blastocladiella britannica]